MVASVFVFQYSNTETRHAIKKLTTILQFLLMFLSISQKENILLYYIVESKILKIYSKIFFISSLVKISST